MMWRCLVEKNIRAGHVSNVGCRSEHRPVVHEAIFLAIVVTDKSPYTGSREVS